MARPPQLRLQRTPAMRLADASTAEAVNHDHPPTDADEIGAAVLPSQTLAIVGYFSPAPLGLTLDDIDAVERYVGKASADATKRAYTSDWRIFVAWCDERTIPSLPTAPRAVAAFLAQEADRGVARSTIDRRLAAHRAAGLIAPTEQVGAAVLERALQGIRRDKRTQRPTKKHAADGDILRAIVGEDIRSSRDRALIAIDMCGALRRSELVALQIADVRADSDHSGS